MLFSEPMSINFDAPMRYSSFKRQIPDQSQSLIEENKVSLAKENEDREEMKYQKQQSDVLQDDLVMVFEHKRSRSFDEVTQHPAQQDTHLYNSKLPKSWEIENRLRQKPFHDAIVKLKEINQKEGPMMKVRLLEQVNQMIKNDISKFWKGMPINESHLTITQDTKIPLYIFIVIKAKIVNLAAHIKFIQEFTTNYVHENNLGSNLALYESAMTIIAD